MRQDFQISGIPAATYAPLFDLSDQALHDLGARKVVADSHPGFPCRVSLADAQIGEEVLLLPFEHHPVDSPYRASGPVYIRKAAKSADLAINEIPIMLLHRLLSLRVYDEQAMMINALTIPGTELHVSILEILKENRASYIHIHNAGPGCFNCQVNRV